MRDAQNILEVETLGIDWMGLIFYPHSPRYVGKVPAYLPTKARRVGVFVDESLDVICRRIEDYGLQLVQLHGNETPRQCVELRQAMPQVEIIKAFSISSRKDFDLTKLYEKCRAADYFLFDTFCQAKGGSGKTFDHSLLQHYKGTTPFLLSGGLSPDNATQIQAVSHPMLLGYDLNSRFEKTYAIKDPLLITQFITTLKDSKKLTR